MANTSATELVTALTAILRYGNGTGSVNFYMAHGGSNWGFWAGVCSHLLAAHLPSAVLLSLSLPPGSALCVPYHLLPA